MVEVYLSEAFGWKVVDKRHINGYMDTCVVMKMVGTCVVIFYLKTCGSVLFREKEHVARF